MRSMIVALILLLLSISLMLMGSLHLAHCCDRLLSDLSALPQKNDPASEVVEMQQYWSERQWLLSATIPRSSVQRIAEALLTLECHAKNDSIANRTARDIALTQLRYALTEIKRNALPFNK